MLGAIAGDIAGSPYEFDMYNIKTKEFEFMADVENHPKCRYTDDSVLTLAIAKALMESKKSNYDNLAERTTHWMRQLGNKYATKEYGGNFKEWLKNENMGPYNSCGNGAAMRVSAVGRVANSLEEVKKLSRIVTEVTHNHKEGIKGAEATAVAIYLARTGWQIPEIKYYINESYYKMDFTLDEIRESYRHVEICQKTVPQALEAFFESKNYEDAIRNAVSIGGDSDTIAAITGGIAEAYWNVPKKISDKARKFFINAKELLRILNDFEKEYPPSKMRIDESQISQEEKDLHEEIKSKLENIKSNETQIISDKELSSTKEVKANTNPKIDIKTILAIILGIALLAGTATVATLTFGAALIPALAITKIAIALGALCTAALFIYAAFNQKTQNDKCRNLSNNSLTKDDKNSINTEVTKETNPPSMSEHQQELQKL